MSNQNLTEQLEMATQQFMANSPSAMKFRFTVAISRTTSDFALFDSGYGVRTPIKIVCHISQLLQN